MKLAPGFQWPLLITASLLFTVGANVVMLVAASSDRNGSVVEPDYYRKGVEWDRTMARRAESARLGWRAAAAIRVAPAEEPATSPRVRRLEVTLADSSGVAIVGAAIAAVLIHNRSAATPVRVVLIDEGGGRYAATLPDGARGLWEVRLEARRAEQRFGATLHVEAP